jgi:hypothetical protein
MQEVSIGFRVDWLHQPTHEIQLQEMMMTENVPKLLPQILPFPPRPRTTLARLFRQSLIERAIPYRRPLYAGAKSKFDGGRESTGITDDPLMVVGPGESRFGIKYESRSIPFSSAPRDVIRLTLFTLSVRGIAFLAKQQLLQTGNTFAQTRIINPAFAIGNAVPIFTYKTKLKTSNGKVWHYGTKRFS